MGMKTKDTIEPGEHISFRPAEYLEYVTLWLNVYCAQGGEDWFDNNEGKATRSFLRYKNEKTS